ncbi:hypothetical protein Tco_1009264 [Tanacetum coccineum]
MNALKARQSPTTIHATILHFEENSGQSFSGKEVKDNCFKGAPITEVADECESIDKNKANADRQFTELLQLLKALQPPTTLPATIPRFEENSGQCFSSDKVEKEELILMSMDKDGMINKNEFAVVAPVVAVAPIVVAPIVVAPIVVTPIAVAPVAPVVVTPIEPSFIPLGRKINKIKQNRSWDVRCVYKNEFLLKEEHGIPELLNMTLWSNTLRTRCFWGREY